jgi:hypothetical protein
MKSVMGFSSFKKGVNHLLYTSEKQLQPQITSKSTNFSEYALLGGFLAAGLFYANRDKKMHAWIYRDDIGAPNGIHGYEEMVNSVGGHHGHYHWPQEQTFSTFNSATYYLL